MADELLVEIDSFMDKIADKIFAYSQENLVKPHMKDFKSGKSKTIITSDTGFLMKTANVNRSFLKKEIVYPAPYASDIEFGNAGIQVRPEDLIKWVRRKLFKGKGTESSIMRTAINISNSLSERGQSPDPYLEPAILRAISEAK